MCTGTCWRICFSNRFSGNIDIAGPALVHWELLLYWFESYKMMQLYCSIGYLGILSRHWVSSLNHVFRVVTDETFDLSFSLFLPSNSDLPPPPLFIFFFLTLHFHSHFPPTPSLSQETGSPHSPWLEFITGVVWERSTEVKLICSSTILRESSAVV